MCVKLSSENLNSCPCFPHLTSIYTCEITTASKVRGCEDNSWLAKNLFVFIFIFFRFWHILLLLFFFFRDILSRPLNEQSEKKLKSETSKMQFVSGERIIALSARDPIRYTDLFLSIKVFTLSIHFFFLLHILLAMKENLETEWSKLICFSFSLTNGRTAFYLSIVITNKHDWLCNFHMKIVYIDRPPLPP